MPLGFLIAGASMKVASAGGLGAAGVLVAALILGLVILDTTLVMVSRRRGGRPLMTGGRDHLTHRLRTRLQSPRAVAARLRSGQLALCAATIARRAGGHRRDARLRGDSSLAGAAWRSRGSRAARGSTRRRRRSWWRRRTRICRGARRPGSCGAGEHAPHRVDHRLAQPTMRRQVLRVLALALLVRVAIGLLLVGDQGGDALEYQLLGDNLAHGHGFSLSSAAPYHPTDWRPPGYPVVLSFVSLSGESNAVLVLANSLLGVLTVGLLMLMASRVFEPTRLVTATGLVAALYPPFITYTGVAYAENLAIPAICLFVYVAFLHPMPKRGWIWVLAVGGAAVLIAMTRAEGIALVVLGVVLASWFRRLPVVLVAAALIAVVAVPLAWAARNEHVVHRFELGDPLDRDVTLVLSTNDGDFTDPLYRRGVTLGHDGTSSSAARDAYHDDVTSAIRHAFDTNRGHVLAYKAKSLLNFPFTIPVVWTWAAERDYSLSDAATDSSVATSCG